MAEIGLSSLVIAAAVAGFVNGMLNPLGKFIYEQYLEPHVKRIDRNVPRVIKGHVEKKKPESYL